MAICGEHKNTWRTPEELLLDPLYFEIYASEQTRLMLEILDEYGF